MQENKRLKILTPKEVITIFEQLGWVHDRTSGSHAILSKKDSTSLSIPLSNKIVSRGTLRNNIHRAGITIEEFNELA